MPVDVNEDIITIDITQDLISASTDFLPVTLTLDLNSVLTDVQNNVIAAQFIIDGGGSVIPQGLKGYLEIPFDCLITGVTLLADQTGSIHMDIWKTTYANFNAGVTHPVLADSIVASAPPSLVNAYKSQDLTLTGWTTTISRGDILAFVVSEAVISITRLTISIKLQRN